MKLNRMLSLVLVFSMLMTFACVPVSAQQITFSDIDGAHWAYEFVKQLVEDGTVKGYEDGSFRPDGTVTRAEFVKMIGKGQTVKEKDYIDVPKNHWGYDYIMAAGFKTEDEKFLPDTPITRAEVLELLWMRSGSKEGVVAPGVIKNQAEVKDSAAWGYTYGIMIGNDGYNLRLEDQLTRAEAAALIIRGRNYASATPVNFKDTVSEELLKRVVLQSGLFDFDTSDLSRKVTNGELAMAVMRLMYGEDDPFVTKVVEGTADCKYGEQWAEVASSYLNITDYTEKMVNTEAKFVDALAALVVAAVGKHEGSNVKLGDGYEGVELSGNIKMPLQFAKGAEIFFDTTATFNPDKDVTLKDIALILIQIDGTYGLKSSYANGRKIDEQIQKDLDKYPSNWKDYEVILEAVPAYVYEEADSEEGFMQNYDFAREYPAFMFNALTRLAKASSKDPYVIKFTYYPELLKSNDKFHIAMKAKMTVATGNSSITFKEVFGEQFKGEDQPIKNCFVEIVTATPMNTAIYPETDLIITKVID